MNCIIHARPKKMIPFRNGSLLFNPQYLCQFLIKSNNLDQFRNPQDELISKLSLLVRFDQELAEILRVKEKASISKSTRFFCRRVYKDLALFYIILTLSFNWRIFELVFRVWLTSSEFRHRVLFPIFGSFEKRKFLQLFVSSTFCK